MGSTPAFGRTYDGGCSSLWTWSLLLVIMMGHPVATFFYEDPVAELTPTFNLYEEGSPLQLTCTILDSELVDSFSGSDISFAVKLKNKNLTQIYTILDTTSFEVVATDAETVAARLTIPSLTLDYHNALVTCRLPGRDFYLESVKFGVASAPEVPRLTGCVVDNWETMTCYWGPHYSKQNHTNANNHLIYTVHWKTKRESKWHIIHKGPAHVSEDMHRHTWLQEDFQMGMKYNINITARIHHNDLPDNHTLRVMSDIEEINTEFIVKPRAPHTLARTLVDSHTLQIDIQRPDAGYPTQKQSQFFYRLCYNTTHTRQHCFTSNDNTTMTVSVQPYTRYTFQVACKTRLSNLWSDNTTFKYNVPKAEPTVPAVVPPFGFRITRVDERSNSRLVALYWKPVPVEFYNAPILWYTLSTRTSVDDEWVFLDNVSEPYYRSTLDEFTLDATYVRILAGNSEGWKKPVDPETSQMYIPSQDKVIKEKPKLIVERMNLTAYNLTLAGDGLQLNSSQSLTLYYCLAKINDHVCKEQSSLQWKPLNVSEPFWIETLDSLEGTEDHYLFGVSVASSPDTTTGLDWAHCSYNSTVLVEVKDLQVSPSSSTELLVTWHLPSKCNYLYTEGYVRTIRVIYHPNTCNEPSEGTVVEPGYKMMANLVGLAIDTPYCVQVIAVTSAGPYPSIKEIIGRTRSEIHPGAYAGIAIAVLFAMIMAGYGLYVVCNRCKGHAKRYNADIPIFVPGADPRFQLSSTSSDLPLCSNGSLSSGFTRMTSVDSHDSGVSLPNNYRYSDGTLAATTYVGEGSSPCSIPNGHPLPMSIFPPNNVSINQLPKIPETEDLDEVFEEPVMYKTCPEESRAREKPEKNNNSNGSPVHYTTIQPTRRQYENTTQDPAPTSDVPGFDCSTCDSMPQMMSNEGLSEYTVVAPGEETPQNSREHTPVREKSENQISPARTDSPHRAAMLPSNVDYVDNDMNPVVTTAIDPWVMGNHGKGNNSAPIQSVAPPDGYISHNNIPVVPHNAATGVSPVSPVSNPGYVTDPMFMVKSPSPFSGEKSQSVPNAGYVTHAEAARV